MHSPIWLGLACVWLLGFFLFFNSFVLPNSAPQTTRVDVWFQAPEIYAGLIAGPPGSVGQSPPQSGWRYFPQRLDVIAVSGFVLLSSWVLGALLLRLLRLPSSLTRVERFVFSAGLGMGGVSLLALGCGLAGALNRTLFVAGLSAFAILAAVCWLRDRRRTGEPAEPDDTSPETPTPGPVWLRRACPLAVVPFVLAIWLGAMLPSFDFDVKEYHLQGPKEFFQNGRIEFLRHNVYTSFPFLTEMLSLTAMVVRGDWYRGALAGKAVLAGFSLLSALAVYAAGRRLFGAPAGWVGLLIHLTTPWTYRISIIAYAEGGLTFYLIASLLALIVAVRRATESPGREAAGSKPMFLLAGLLAGCGMSCKYPGVVQVVIPLGISAALFAWIAPVEVASRWRVALRSAGLFALGTVLAVGPWLVKNIAETGNPVYPLLGSIFDGEDWDADLDAKWRAGHSPPDYDPADVGVKLIDVVAKSDWQSGLVFAFAPLAFFGAARRRAGWLWLYVGCLFAAWWVLTHRIDRFWIPLLPVAAVLAGAGAVWSSARVWRVAAGSAIGLTLIYNLAFIVTPLCGYNAYLIDDEVARKDAETTSVGIPFLNANLPADARVLCVGEAQVFDLRRDVVYNTVFDRSIFQKWFGQPVPGTPPGEWPLRPPETIRMTLREEGITHVYVNWDEVRRYRSTYGFTEFVTPQRFQQLVQAGVLDEPLATARHRFQVFPVRRER
ncbi:MAG: ArnT family glycosyltransferase [Planctomycetaceae bacterium]